MSRLVEPMGLPRLLDEAVTETRQGNHRLLLIVASGLAAISGLYALVTNALMGSLTSGLGCGALVLTILMMPVMIAAVAVGYTALGISATRRIFGGELPARETLRDSVRLPVLVTLFLTTILMVFSLMFFILPIFLTSVLFSLIFQVMVVENRYGLDCIRRSSELVWRNPRGLLRTAPVLGTMAIQAVFVAISTLLTLAIQLPYQIFSQAAIWRASLGGEATLDGVFALLWLQVPLSVVSTLVSTAAAYYLFHVLALYYRDLRERREALSLEAAISSWERQSSAPPSAATGADPAFG